MLFSSFFVSFLFFFLFVEFILAMTQSGTMASLHNVDDKVTPIIAPIKSKRATSFVRKKPPLERGLSAQSALRVNRNPFVCKKSFNVSNVSYCLLFNSMNVFSLHIFVNSLIVI